MLEKDFNKAKNELISLYVGIKLRKQDEVNKEFYNIKQSNIGS